MEKNNKYRGVNSYTDLKNMRLNVESEIEELNTIIKDIPKDRVLEIKSFKGRLEKVKKELKDIKTAIHTW